MSHFFRLIADAIAPRHRKIIFFRELVPAGVYPRHLFDDVVDEADIVRRMRDYQARGFERFHV